jgi:hypothetical protein
MKKRILLIMAFSISFTPAVFAAATGEQKMSEMRDNDAFVGVACNRARDFTKKDETSDGTSQSAADRSGRRASSASL